MRISFPFYRSCANCGAIFLSVILLAGIGGVFAQDPESIGQQRPSIGAGATQGNQLPPDIAAKANDLREASIAYLKAKCDGADRRRQEAARSLRDSLRDQLNNLIASNVSQLPEVQGALDAATDAGEVASNTRANPNADDQEKAAARANFEIARSYLNDVAETARDQIEALLKNKGVALAASADDCPDKNQNAERKQPQKRRAPASDRNRSPSQGPATPRISPGVELGSIEVGGVGITIGR